MARRGYVYCIANDAIPGIVKIGATVRDPEDRLSEARATTWAPSCFRIIAQAAVDDAFAAEHALHALLAARRFEARREFFALTHAEARAVFDVVALASAPAQHARPVVASLHAPLAPLARDEPVSAVQHAREQPVSAVPVSPEDRLRAWVEEHYTHVPLREKDKGTKLEPLYTAYATSAPPVHAKPLGKILFAKMLNSVFPNIGPHKNGACTVSGLYLLR
jgi:hypothetical protein